MSKEQDFQKAKDNFKFLMDCIDEYVNKGKSERHGQLYFIDNSEVAYLAVTSRKRGGIRQLKSYFCNNILGLWGDGELNIKEYEDYFDGVSDKKYSFNIEGMNRYLDREGNIAKIQEVFEEAIDEEEWELGTWQSDAWDVVPPVLLLDELKKQVYYELAEYLIRENANENQVDEEKSTGDTKKEWYQRFINAACLYEIFVKKFLEENAWERGIDGLAAAQEAIEEGEKTSGLCEKIENTLKAYEEKKMPKDEAADTINVCMVEIDLITKNVEKLVSSYVYGIMRVYFFVRHARFVMTLCSVIALIEFAAMNEPGAPKRLQMEEKWENLKRFMSTDEQDSFFMKYVKFNKNISKVYEELNQYMAEQKMIKDITSSDVSTRLEIVGLIKQYFKQVKKVVGGNSSEEFEKVVSDIFWKYLE